MVMVHGDAEAIEILAVVVYAAVHPAVIKVHPVVGYVATFVFSIHSVGNLVIEVTEGLYPSVCVVGAPAVCFSEFTRVYVKGTKLTVSGGTESDTH